MFLLLATNQISSSLSTETMNPTASNTASKNWLHILFAVGLLVSFFLAWVIWDGSKISGYSMPSGAFFKKSAAQFGLDNPFPQFNFLFLVFWLIPALALAILLLAGTKKRTGIFAFIAGALSLSLVTVYILFTKVLIDMGAGFDLFKVLQAPVYLHIISATGLILTTAFSFSLLKKTGWILAGPIFAFASFMFIQSYLEKQTFENTITAKTDYTINAETLIKEFIANDTVTNKKYLDKTLVVNGNASAVEMLADSTTTIKFSDSTGSYAIFSLEKNQLDQVKNIKSGDAVSLKGVCSGSIFSEILGTTSISFKRATLNKK